MTRKVKIGVASQQNTLRTFNVIDTTCGNDQIVGSFNLPLSTGILMGLNQDFTLIYHNIYGIMVNTYGEDVQYLLQVSFC